MSKLQAKECQTVEYKSTWHDKYLEWICGFANAQGAVMYIGVNDNHEVIGLDHIDKLMEDIPNKIVNSMGIVADVNLRKQDGLEYIEVAVAPSNVPVSYKGKYYYRSGSTMQELTGPALTDFLMRKMNTSWDMTTEPSATIDDIDPSAIKYFINAAIREGRINP
ncbi:MAG: ATP-binding protein, partial [Paludibacteraceae bacterium]|nr:ATP-binding protein [Paludibacteraceae bacterium]